MKKVIAIASIVLLMSSCNVNEPKNKFKDPTAEYIKLEKGERLQGVAFMNGAELYVRTTMDTTPPKKHYLQKYLRRSFKVRLVIEEQ